MKKNPQKIVTLVAILFIVCIVGIGMLFGRDKEPIDDNRIYDSQNDIYVEVEFADLTPVPEYDYLYYSINTHQVYYLFKLGSGQTSRGYMAPYLSNGHTCKYEGREIVEIIE